MPRKVVLIALAVHRRDIAACALRPNIAKTVLLLDIGGPLE